MKVELSTCQAIVMLHFVRLLVQHEENVNTGQVILISDGNFVEYDN